MVPKFLQTGSSDILASIRHQVLSQNNNATKKPPVNPEAPDDATELPLVTPPKKAVIATATQGTINRINTRTNRSALVLMVNSDITR